MRPRIYIPLLLLVALTIHLLFKLYSFLTIFFISHHTGILITQTQALQAHESQNPDTRTQYIPKKIHQVYHDWSGNNTAIPSDWDEVRKTCQDLNEGWEYTVRITSITSGTVYAAEELLFLWFPAVGIAKERTMKCQC
jgi:mannosyltransferase OCH1-like enzyme